MSALHSKNIEPEIPSGHTHFTKIEDRMEGETNFSFEKNCYNVMNQDRRQPKYQNYALRRCTTMTVRLLTFQTLPTGFTSKGEVKN